MSQCESVRVSAMELEQLGDLRQRLNSVLVGLGETSSSADSGDVQPASVIVYNPGVQTGATDTGLLNKTASCSINLLVTYLLY